MQVSFLDKDRKEEWNAFVMKEPYFSLLQSWEWGEFKKKMGWKVFRIAVEDHGFITAGAQVLIKPLLAGFASMAYIPRGPVGNWLDKESAHILVYEIHRIGRLNKAIFLKIEPPLLNDRAVDEFLRQLNFRSSSVTNQPRSTILLNLDLDHEDILRKMRKRTREYINYSSRKGVTVRFGGRKDFPAFYSLLKMTSQRADFAVRCQEYYEREFETFADNNQVAFLMASYQDRLLAVHMAFCFGKYAAYFHGGSLNENSKELRPNYLLVWEAIKWAKARGCRIYDLWGIPEEVGLIVSTGKKLPVSDRTDGLWGLYRFKSGFSKNIVCYTGAYDYVYSPLIYALIANKLFHTKTIERVISRLDRI